MTLEKKVAREKKKIQKQTNMFERRLRSGR